MPGQFGMARDLGLLRRQGRRRENAGVAAAQTIEAAQIAERQGVPDAQRAVHGGLFVGRERQGFAGKLLAGILLNLAQMEWRRVSRMLKRSVGGRVNRCSNMQLLQENGLRLHCIGHGYFRQPFLAGFSGYKRRALFRSGGRQFEVHGIDSGREFGFEGAAQHGMSGSGSQATALRCAVGPDRRGKVAVITPARE
jgi:hypothetical protein